MGYEFSALGYIRFLAGIFALSLIWLLWRQKHSRIAVYLMLFELSAAVWAIGDGFEAAAGTVTAKMHWAQFAYLGISFCALMFLMFALSYTNQTRFVKTRTLLLLLVIPVITIVVAFTNPLHGLLWKKIVIPEGTRISEYSYGPYFWIIIFYSYTLLVTGIIVLLAGSFKAYSLHRIQFWLLILGTLIPFTASILYVLKLFPIKGFDPTPVSFIVCGIIIAISLYWFRMFNIIPIARNQAIDNLRDGMLVVDSGNQIVDANSAFCKILDTQPRQLIGVQADEFFSRINADISKFSAENDFTIEIQIGSGPDIQDYEMKYHPITDTNQRQLGSIYMLSNMTTRKMILDAIADSNNRRRLELIEKEKLILDLDAYARSVAHDLRNPTGLVVSLSELINMRLSENDMDEVPEMIGLVREQSNKMIRIIDELLLLSRIRKEDVSRIPINMMGDILSEVIKRLENEIEAQKATLNIPGEWPKVLGHNQWIEEVWLNLMSNALKYGGRPPVITLGSERISPALYRFWIQDNGNGLSEISLKKIFNDFERLGIKDTEGYGLGLPIVKRIIEKLGGEVWATSTGIPGEGCIFSFTLAAAD